MIAIKNDNYPRQMAEGTEWQQTQRCRAGKGETSSTTSRFNPSSMLRDS